jgi:hypothetical protein
LKHKTAITLFATLVVLAFILLCAILWQSAQGPPGPGPSVATDVGLFSAVIFCVCIDFWMTFVDNGTKNGRKAMLVVELIFGTAVFGLTSFAVFIDGASLGPYWLQTYPATFNNITLAWHFLFVIAVILALATILAVVLTLGEHSAQANLKAKIERCQQTPCP